MSENVVLGVDLDEYRYGFRDKEDYVFKSRKGLDHEIVDEISWMKREPEWMRWATEPAFVGRLDGLRVFPTLRQAAQAYAEEVQGAPSPAS